LEINTGGFEEDLGKSNGGERGYTHSRAIKDRLGKEELLHLLGRKKDQMMNKALGSNCSSQRLILRITWGRRDKEKG